MSQSTNRSLLRRDADAFLHQRNSTPVDGSFRAVEGVWAEDVEGHRFMDLHGNTCHNVGYRHPRLIAALKAQLDELSFTPRGFTNEIAVALAERLAALWPYGPARVLFGLSGTDAIEMALKLAFVATGRHKTLAFEDAWHGAALGALWVGGRAAEREDFPPLEGCRHVPSYWQGSGGESAANLCMEAIRRHLIDEGGFACLLAEPFDSAVRRPPAWFWPQVQALCRQSGTLLVFDEIPKGLGKTGRLFASQHADVTPDMSVIGKSLGGAVVPLSALIARADLNVAGHRAIGHYTHQKNPLLARAGLTVLDIIEEEGLVEAAQRQGALLAAELKALAARTALLGRIEHLGLLVEVEIAAPGSGPALRQACFRRGLNLSLSGERYLELSPPLTITDAEINRCVAMLEAAAQDVGLACALGN